MMKKMFIFVIILFGTLGYRSSGMALEIKVDKEGGISNRVVSVDGISDQDSESEELKEIEEQMKQMLDEVKRLEGELKKKVQKELLPIIRKEIERLKKWLREFQPEDEEKKPRKVMIRKEGLDGYQRMRALPQVKPPPNTGRQTRLPSLILPSRTASSRAMAQDAEEILPYLCMVT